jgi:creatinine amidohydrolase/Fe(II)-dependent formamide hydrolase-like protein
MFLEKMRTTDFDPNKKYTFVLPLGATEQHGPFLALGTDSFIADRIILDVEPSFPDIIFLPTSRITCSEEHEGFPGTAWITKETMNSFLLNICHSFQPYAQTIAFVSFHGGNLALLDSFVAKNSSAFAGMRMFHLPAGSEETEQKMRDMIGGAVDTHAGNVEISMMFACDESLADIPPQDYPKHVIQEPFSTNHLKDFSEDGIADNHPKWVVSKEHGRKMIAWSVQDLKNELHKIT